MKKKTVVRKISWKEYVTVLWILEHRKQYEEGEICDLSMFPQEQLESVEKRCLYVNDEENEIIREYLGARRKKNTFESMVKDVPKDPKYVTKIVGSTIRYKTVNAVANPIISNSLFVAVFALLNAFCISGKVAPEPKPTIVPPAWLKKITIYLSA